MTTAISDTQNFDNDTQKQASTWLHRIIQVSLILTLGHILILFLGIPDAQIPIALDGGLFIAFLLAYGFYYLSRIQMARLWIVLALWGYITVGSILLGGVENPLIAAYIIFVLIVTLLYSEREAIICLFISLVTLFAIFIAHVNQWLPPSAIELTPSYIWITVLANLIAIVLLIYFLLNITQTRYQQFLKQSTLTAQEREQSLSALHDITVALTHCDTLDELFEQAIVLGRSNLKIDRMGLLLFDENSQLITGTYGTDIEGNVRNESYLVRPLVEAPIMYQVIREKQPIQIVEDTMLYDEWEVVGRGWRILSVLWDGDHLLGWLACDNLLSKTPLSKSTIDILRTYSATLAQLMVRKQAEENLRYSEQTLAARSELLKAINKMAERLHQTRDVSGVLESTTDALTELLKASTTYIYLLNDTRDLLQIAHHHNPILPVPQELSLDNTLSGFVVRHKTVIMSDDFLNAEQLSPITREQLAESGVRLMVFIPIVFGEDVLGVIVLAFKNESRLETSDYQTYTAIGQSVGLALANAKFINEIQLEKDFSDSIIESIPNIFYMFSADGELIRWNNNFAAILGYSDEALTPLRPHDLVTKSDQVNVDTLIQKTLASGNASAYIHLATSQGQELPYILSTRRYEMQGRNYILGTGMDLSDRMKLLEQLQYQTRQLQTAGDISKSIVTVLHKDKLAQYSVDLICERFDLYYVGLFVVGKNNDYAILNAGSGRVGRDMLTVGYRLKLDGNSMIGRSITQQEAIIAANVAIESGYYANPYLPETRAEMALPLMNRGECLGALTVQSTTLNAFTSDDIAIMRFIADHLASAIVNTRLYEVIDRRQRYLSTLRHVTQRAMPEHKLTIFMQTVTDMLAKEFEYDFAGMFLVNNIREEITMGAYFDRENRDIADKVWDFNSGILGHVMRTQQPYLCVDSAQDPYYYARYTIETIPRSVLVVPITRYEVIVGLLAIHRSGIGTLDELDLEIMGELALEMGLHMENIRLYVQTQQNASELESRVESRTSQLQTVNRELESFAYSVSHDLRAPLRSIDGFSQALLEDYHEALDEDGKQFLERIRAASQRMGQLIDDLLTLSRVTRREFKTQMVNLSAIATEIMDTLSSQEAERKAEIIIEADVVVEGDARMLRIVLENLLGNAWKFTSVNETSVIEFTSQQHGNEKVYRVRDNGVGFNMEYADKLFKAFQRLHAMNEFEGTGIGLATVKRVIDRHGGRIWVDAVENEGATFYFTIGDIIEASQL